MQPIDVGRMEDRQAAAVLGLEQPTGRAKYGPRVMFRRDTLTVDGAPWAPPAPWLPVGALLVRRWGMNGRVTTDSGREVAYKTWLTGRGARPERGDGLDTHADGSPRTHAVLLAFRRPCACCNQYFELTVPYYGLRRFARGSVARMFTVVRCPKCRKARAAARAADPIGHKRALATARKARYRAKKRHADWCNTQRVIPPGALAERGPCNCHLKGPK